MEVNYRYESKNEDKKKNVIDLFSSKKFGTTVTYEEVADVSKLNYLEEYDLIYLKQFVGNLKELLLSRKIVIKSIKNVGWYILKPSQIASYTYRNYILKPIRKYEKATNILNCVDKQFLNEDRKEEYHNVYNLNDELKIETDRILFNSKYYKNKAFYDNLED